MTMPCPPNALRAVALSTLACLPVHAGCEPVDGGAVEVSWDLRRTDGGDVGACDEANVNEIQLWWDVDGRRRSVAFPCDDARGVTVFDLPPGEATLWLRPVCAGGIPLRDDSFRAPAPIVRTITEGEVVTLVTQVIEVKLTGCTADAPCICDAAAAARVNAPAARPSISPAVRRQLASHRPTTRYSGLGPQHDVTSEAVLRPQPVTTSLEPSIGEKTP